MPLILAVLLFPINDITTTPDRPPVFVTVARLEANKGRDLTYNNKLIERQMKLYPDLAPIQSSLGPAAFFKRVIEAASVMPDWEVLDVDEANFRLEAIATTPMLKFKDDVVIEVRPEAQGSSVHMRSKSRMGKSDLGANYKRIKNFLQSIKSN